MYIVKLKNNEIYTEIHGEKEKLKTGNVVKGINSIDSFSFSMMPSNKGWGKIQDYKTLVTVYNTNKNRYEFHGRVLYSNTTMDESGLIAKEVTCESFFGFLCDSKQKYVEEKNWTVNELFEYIINVHNEQVEDYKKFVIGEVTVIDPNDNLYLGIQRENTWKTIEEKLLKKLGGEIRFRVVDDVTYIDYLVEIGTARATEIKLSRNMKSITKEVDPSSYVTRLIPLGSKLKVEETTTDEEGNETTQIVTTEERLDITSINDGKDYIDDETAIEAFGIHVGYAEFDDVTDPNNLLLKGRNWLSENNKLQIKYKVTALDLSLLGLDIDDFEVCNWHPIKNPLLGIDDVARIIKKNIDVVNGDVATSIEIGDNFKTLSDIQKDQTREEAENVVGEILGDYVTNEELVNESSMWRSLIQQTVNNILLKVSETYSTKSESAELKKAIESQMELSAKSLDLRFTETTEEIEKVDGDLQAKFNKITKYFTFDIDGLTIGQVDNPFKVVIDNDRYSMFVNGQEVLWLDPDTGSNIPSLKIDDKMNLLGYVIEGDDSTGTINCGWGGDA